MPEHLIHLAHSLSYCTENQRKAEKVNNKVEAKYWADLHHIFHRAGVQICELNYKRIEK
jgi:hypothetical protein